jgi:hypothetical protein
VSDRLSITFHGEHYYATPIGVHGTALMCSIPGTSCGSIIVLEHMAGDKDKFWRAWKSLGGAQQDLIWEDGSPFGPPASLRPASSPAIQSGMCQTCGPRLAWWIRVWKFFFGK